MNRIETLELKNVKSVTGKYQLAPVTIVTGDNWKGKTAILVAAKLVMLGYDPKLGKKATFEACGQPGGGATLMKVSQKLTDGTSTTRQWEMKKGKVSYTGPEDPLVSTYLLDPTTYFDLSGPAKLDYVLSMVDLAKLGIGHDGFIDQLGKAIQPSNDVERQAFDDVKLLARSLEDARKEEDASVYEWFTTLVDKLADLVKTTKGRADTYEQTVKGLVDAKATDGDLSANTSWQGEINDLSSRRDMLLQDLSQLKTRQRQHANQQADIARWESQVKVWRDNVVDLDELHQQVKSFTQKVSEWDAVKSDEDSCRREVSLLEAELAINKNKIENLKSQIKQLDIGLARDLNSDCCPYCGCDGANWKEAITRKITGDVAELQEKVHHAKQQVKTVDEQLNDKRLELEKFDVKCRDAIDARDSMRDLERRINTYTGYKKASEEAERNLAGVLKIELDAMDGTGLEAEVKSIDEKLVELNKQQRQFVARTQDARRAEQTRQMFEVEAGKLGIYKEALKVVKAEKERASEDAFNNLLKTANRLTNGILRAPLVFRDGELGMVADGNWVAYRVFSGTEELIAFAGMSIALTNGDGPRVVLMDELGRLKRSNKIKLVERILQLIKEGVIDQMIGVDVDGDAYAVTEDITVIKID